VGIGRLTRCGRWRAGFGDIAKEVHGTAIVTTAASEETQQIRDRMPVVLEKLTLRVGLPQSPWPRGAAALAVAEFEGL
jgi:putative SOS response-associated peptidase YedK